MMKAYLIAALAATLLTTAAEAAPVDRGLEGGSKNAGHGGSNCCGTPSEFGDRDFDSIIGGHRGQLGGNNAVRGTRSGKHSSQGSVGLGSGNNAGRGTGFGSDAGDND